MFRQIRTVDRSLCTRVRRLLASAAVVTAVGAAVLVPAQVASAADFGTIGECWGAIPSIPGTTVGSAANIHIEPTTVSVVDESPYLTDTQKVVRDLYLYWWNGSTWIYSGTWGEDYTFVTESTGGVASPTSSTWMTGTSWSDPSFPIPTLGYSYAVGMQLRWISQRTGGVVQSYWHFLSNLLGYDRSGNYDYRSYCDFGVNQPS